MEGPSWKVLDKIGIELLGRGFQLKIGYSLMV
jgi:hypothetical protein